MRPIRRGQEPPPAPRREALAHARATTPMNAPGLPAANEPEALETVATSPVVPAPTPIASPAAGTLWSASDTASGALDASRAWVAREARDVVARRNVPLPPLFLEKGVSPAVACELVLEPLRDLQPSTAVAQLKQAAPGLAFLLRTDPQAFHAQALPLLADPRWSREAVTNLGGYLLPLMFDSSEAGGYVRANILPAMAGAAAWQSRVGLPFTTVPVSADTQHQLTQVPAGSACQWTDILPNALAAWIPTEADLSFVEPWLARLGWVGATTLTVQRCLLLSLELDPTGGRFHPDLA